VVKWKASDRFGEDAALHVAVEWKRRLGSDLRRRGPGLRMELHRACALVVLVKM
jgi:hypothetical protein